MASDYPGGLDTFDTIASDKKTSDAVGGRTHRDMHNDLGDAIEAVQTELGTDPAGAYATVKARLEALMVVPTSPTEITGEQGTDTDAILVDLLAALDALGLITDSTTAP